jgi:saccharopine dehydrogenase-like NADP-dependent oxidoreductase
MKNIVVFGAGKSATCLIDYLTGLILQKNWSLTIADSNIGSLQKKLIKSPGIVPVQVDVENSRERTALIKNADIVISLLPPSLHILIARDCITNLKNLLTASYVNEEIRDLSSQIEKKRLFFLCEMGLDPGIDHMSAMQIIHKIKDAGGNITAFRSHTGGLVAPESDDNPWHYKISWNPANVVKAGSAGAVFLQGGQIKRTSYRDLFETTGRVEIKEVGQYAWYPNRDSLAYIPVYGLESARDFIRTTLRHPDFCLGWKDLVKAGLTNDETPVPIEIKTVSEWSKPILPFLNNFNKKLYDQLGLFNNDPLPEIPRYSSQILQALLEKNWMMKETDRDMILMLHEFEYILNDQNHFLRSSLVVKGENAVRTAMARTVGLPLGIAAKLILENKINLQGLHIPIIREIYEPVLAELENEGIRFREELS